MVDVSFLARIPLFEKLSTDDLNELAKYWVPVSREEGQLIFRKGEASQAMYLIRTGQIAITIWTEDNQEINLTILQEGDFFGELGLFDGSPRTANAKVLEHADLLEMKREDFVNFLLRNPEACFALASIIARRLRATNELLERRATRNANEIIEEQLSFGDRVADRVAEFGGSWKFIGAFVGFMALWMIINSIQLWLQPFDEYPFILLNLILSTLAALQAPVIMMSQNRQSVKDRIRAELDYEVNLKAEMQIQSLHTKLDELRTTELRELVEHQRQHIELLKKHLEQKK